MIRSLWEIFTTRCVPAPEHDAGRAILLAERNEARAERDAAREALRRAMDDALDLAGRIGRFSGVAENVADGLDALTRAPDRMIRAGALHDDLTRFAQMLRDAVEMTR